jgi:hypothetical protein
MDEEREVRDLLDLSAEQLLDPRATHRVAGAESHRVGQRAEGLAHRRRRDPVETESCDGHLASKRREEPAEFEACDRLRDGVAPIENIRSDQE